MRSFAALLAAALLGACATATPRPGEYLEVLEGTARITCRGTGMDGAFGSRLARSAMLVAPGGARAAWVEIEAQALGVDDDEGTCQNVSRLWIREGGETFVAFVQKPGWEGRNGNAIDLIDWSPDGARLLLELHTWTYPTDPADPTLLVWDARTRAIEQVEAGARLTERFGSGCRFLLRGAGYDSDGAVVFRVETPADAGASCVSAGQLWRLAPGDARLASHPATPERRGTTSAPPPRTAPADPE